MRFDLPEPHSPVILTALQLLAEFVRVDARYKVIEAAPVVWHLLAVLVNDPDNRRVAARASRRVADLLEEPNHGLALAAYALVVLVFWLATVDANRDAHAVFSTVDWTFTGWCLMGQWYRQYSRSPTMCTGSAGFPQTEQLAATYSEIGRRRVGKECRSR